MNGVSCTYGLASENSCSFPATAIFGTHDEPSTRRFDCSSSSDPIVHVAVSSGNWVTYIEFRTKSGAVYGFGENSEGITNNFSIPNGYELIGFYGGELIFLSSRIIFEFVS